MHGIIRSTETIAIEESGPSIPEAREAVRRRLSAGFELNSVVATMKAGSEVAVVHAVAQSTALREIEAESFSALRAATPAGWQLLSVRT